MNPNHTAVKVSHTSQVSQRWNIMTHTWTENGKHSRQYKKTVQNIWAKAAMTYDLCSQTTRTRVYVLLRLVSAWGVLPIWTKTHRTSLRENEIRVSLNLLAHLYTHMHTHSPAQVHLHQAMIWGWKVSQAICWHPPPSLPAAPTTTSSSVYKYTTLWVFSRAASSNRYSWGESVTVTAWETQKRRKKKKALQGDEVGLLFAHVCELACHHGDEGHYGEWGRWSERTVPADVTKGVLKYIVSLQFKKKTTVHSLHRAVGLSGWDICCFWDHSAKAWARQEVHKVDHFNYLTTCRKSLRNTNKQDLLNHHLFISTLIYIIVDKYSRI